jgi:hypothetical protein
MNPDKFVQYLRMLDKENYKLKVKIKKLKEENRKLKKKLDKRAKKI